MSEILFGKQILEIIVRAEEHPNILINAYDTATISINQIIFVGEIVNVQSKKITDKESGEVENWVSVRLKVDCMAAMGECNVDFPGAGNEIQDKVIFNYIDKDITSTDDEDVKKDEKFNF